MKRMKTLNVRKIPAAINTSDMKGLFEYMDSIEDTQAIDELPWPESYPEKPYARFNIAHSNEEVYIKYYIREEYTRAIHTMTNDAVYEDSAVEFFVKPFDSDPRYYNFEINAIGVIHAACGTGREGRKTLPPSLIEGIRTLSTMGTQPFEEIQGDIQWKVLVAIPLVTLVEHSIDSLSGMKMRANFHKCGDLLSKPHYIMWNPGKRDAPKPEFHLSDYFGEIEFI